ncbi:3-deoxy-D-arabinoheptulosonate-7-phosphate synthase [Spongiibacter sp. IMCC21906]|nr:3-deoxy-D-arabinoheptulosonate-7-phosphate synthase [Spongiibacter sp. IMCC21906]
MPGSFYFVVYLICEGLMSKPIIENLNVEAQEVLITPARLKAALPMSDSARELVSQSRQTIRDILDRTDHRMFIVVGPCSIHDTDAALDYAQRLKKLADEVSDTLLIVMRVYFEKPRTTVGWKGLINDPHLNDTFKIEEGLNIGRKLLMDITEIGLPTATEALDPISPQYLQDFIAWSAIGARTTESQTHREMASGLSSAVGFKNGTDGGISVAMNAIGSAVHPHRFLGINDDGQVAVIHTRGNAYAHVVLRGGSAGPNYDSVHIKLCEEALEKANYPVNIMVDCSHANSNKNPALQPLVVEDVGNQILEGNKSIVGLMIESHLKPGNQSISADLSQLQYGVSVTDGCIGWDDTEATLRKLRDKVKDALRSRNS